MGRWSQAPYSGINQRGSTNETCRRTGHEPLHPMYQRIRVRYAWNSGADDQAALTTSLGRHFGINFCSGDIDARPDADDGLSFR